jgi:hypothetical protein
VLGLNECGDSDDTSNNVYTVTSNVQYTRLRLQEQSFILSFTFIHVRYTPKRCNGVWMRQFGGGVS